MKMDDDNNIDGGGDGELKRGSRQARELSLLLSMLPIMMIMMAVEVNTSICYSLDEIRTFDSGFGLEIRTLTPSRVETIGKR